ncbi:MAG: M20/M25/M40 family metallo-hydrolase, partial [Tepidisphaeraceae bacterium]
MAGDFADIAREAQSPQFRQYMVELLHDLVAIDTTPRADIAALASLEGRVFDAIEGRLNGLGIAGLGVWRVPISPRIEEHRLYSQPYYTATPQHPRGQSADLAYGNRCNLVATIDPSGGGAAPGLALNAHIDVVKPYIPARIESDTVFGRGACDDKGPLASTVGAIKLCASHLQRSGKRITRPITAMFVIDEEIGGNGSLSLAIDRAFRRRYDTLAVLECCSSNIYPANRGAVWYKVEATLPGVNLFETAAFIIEEMECEGRALKAESRHDLFPHRPVQTCHGMIGGFGEHPSRICGRVEFVIRSTGAAGNLSLAVPLVRDLIEDGLAQYVGLYGDKTKALDPSTGKPKVDHHYDLESTESGVIV